MRVGDFELCIVGGLESSTATEVSLRHGQVYQIAATNHGKMRCDVSIDIDGKDVGTWRVLPGKTTLLEHPATQSGRFTFYRLGSSEAKTTHIPDHPETGWIAAYFLPEAAVKKGTDGVFLLAAAEPEWIPDDISLDASAPSDDERGGTALTGKSEQSYGEADDIFTFDLERGATIRMHMKCLSTARPTRETLLNEISSLRVEADKAADDEFDFCKARKLDNLRFEKQREIDLMDMRVEVQKFIQRLGLVAK